jgi:hypothetical protein
VLEIGLVNEEIVKAIDHRNGTPPPALLQHGVSTPNLCINVTWPYRSCFDSAQDRLRRRAAKPEDTALAHSCV